MTERKILTIRIINLVVIEAFDRWSAALAILLAAVGFPAILAIWLWFRA